MDPCVQIANHFLTAQISLKGAQLMSLCTADGTEYLWQRNPMYWDSCAPVLFPIVGALRNGRTLIHEKWYFMKQHGLARHHMFEIEKQSESQVVFKLMANDETKNEYPFSFVLKVAYTLEDDSLKTSFVVENVGSEPMPYAIGGHPGFNVPLFSDECFEDYEVRFEEKETVDCPKIADGGLIDAEHVVKSFKQTDVIPLRHDLFAEDALVFENLNSKAVCLVSRVSGHGVKMNFSQFPMLGIWSARNQGPFVALEPWTGCATRTDESDIFTEKHNMRILLPGQKDSLAYSVKVF